MRQRTHAHADGRAPTSNQNWCLFNTTSRKQWNYGPRAVAWPRPRMHECAYNPPSVHFGCENCHATLAKLQKLNAFDEKLQVRIAIPFEGARKHEGADISVQAFKCEISQENVARRAQAPSRDPDPHQSE